MFKAGISTKDLTSLFLKCMEGHTSSKELNLPNLGCSIFMMVFWKERFCGRVKSQNGLGSMSLSVRRRRRANVKGEYVERTAYGHGYGAVGMVDQLSKSVHSTEVSGHTMEGRKKKFIMTLTAFYDTQE